MASIRSQRPLHSRENSPSALATHNVVVAGHRTSVRLEPVMWDTLRDIARDRDMGLNDLVTAIDRHRRAPNLTAAIRVYIVDFLRKTSVTGDDRERDPPAASLPM
jgi:predicted DNA-binding ribbon-helix-helix protein